MKWIVRLALLGLLVVVAQRLRQQNVQLAALAGDLEGDRQEIARAESELETLDKSIDADAARLRELDAKITAIERDHPAGIPQSMHGAYAALVTGRNEIASEHNLMLARHRTLQDEYKRRVDGHNVRVGEINAVAGRSTAWSTASALWADLVETCRGWLP